MKMSTMAAAAAILALSAGVAIAAEGCECCKEMAEGASMPCCDRMSADGHPNPQPAPPSPPPAPTPAPADAPAPHSGQ